MQATRIQSRIMVILCCIAFTTSTQAQVCGIPQPESVVECVEAQVVQLAYGDHTFCVISPAVDTDVFEFEGTEGDFAKIIIRTTTFLDPRVEVVDPNGKFIHNQVCTGPCSQSIALTLLKSGTYTIIVSDAGSNNTGSYLLQLERVPPATEPPVIFHGLSVSDSISPQTDRDYLTFEGVAGSTIRITVASDNFMDPLLGWWDPNISFLGSESCTGPCAFNITETLSLSGTYLLQLSDVGANNSGSYQLSLECIVGPCKCLEADLDGDGNVSVVDLLQLLGDWGQTCNVDFVAPPGVGVEDLLMLLANWGRCP